ncbi:MAG TPA: ABC transporter substrate-binding protein [Microbacteriaceae bacterium]|nr:ABC transporter substrate-binding protein [Microbacteriaceae bacterium]
MSVSKRSRAAVWSGVALVASSALLLTACAGGSTSGGSATAGADGVQPIASGPRDLTLKLGSLLPQTGSLAFLGPPEIAGVDLGVADVNDAAAGIKVDVVHRDSGDTTTNTATVSATDLLNQGVSAIVGAASSGVTKTVIDQITGAGVIQFSPANTSAQLTTWKDNGLYFRTAPSDVLQGEVLGNTIANDGVSTLGIIYLNDAYGSGLDKFVSEAFEKAGGKVVANEAFNEGDSNFASQIAAVTAAKPDAVALITFDQAKTIAPALVAAGVKGSQMYFVDGNVADYSKDFTPGLLEGAKGTVPGLDTAKLGDFTERLLGVDSTLTDYSYAAESYDAVVLIALAAYAANSTDGATIAKYLRQVSGGVGGGEKVTNFKDGAKLLSEGKQIDYDGYSGPVTFDENGDPTEATIGIYQAQNDNTWKRIGDG